MPVGLGFCLIPQPCLLPGRCMLFFLLLCMVAGGLGGGDCERPLVMRGGSVSVLKQSKSREVVGERMYLLPPHLTSSLPQPPILVLTLNCFLTSLPLQGGTKDSLKEPKEPSSASRHNSEQLDQEATEFAEEVPSQSKIACEGKSRGEGKKKAHVGQGSV